MKGFHFISIMMLIQRKLDCGICYTYKRSIKLIIDGRPFVAIEPKNYLLYREFFFPVRLFRGKIDRRTIASYIQAGFARLMIIPDESFKATTSDELFKSDAKREPKTEFTYNFLNKVFLMFYDANTKYSAIFYKKSEYINKTKARYKWKSLRQRSMFNCLLSCRAY